MLIHLVFGMAPDFGGKPWTWFHHVAVETARLVNRPDQIVFWYEHEPAGEWWERSRPHLTLHKIEAPTEVFGRPLLHPAHQADVVRLRALLEHGGVYVDSDVWCLRPFAELGHCGFWMGRQGRRYGLCNATMGGERDSPFAARWLEAYQTFRSQGRDQHWDEHSVRIPLALAEQHPEEITVFPETHFFHPLWGELHRCFHAGHAAKLRSSYSVHLWESICWNWLEQLGPQTINHKSELGRRLKKLGIL
jgi:hypothetical protein